MRNAKCFRSKLRNKPAWVSPAAVTPEKEPGNSREHRFVNRIVKIPGHRARKDKCDRSVKIIRIPEAATAVVMDQEAETNINC